MSQPYEPNAGQSRPSDPPPEAQSFPPPPPPPQPEPEPQASATGYGYGQPAVMAVPGLYPDQASGLSLPEGTQLASVGRRIGAYFLAIPLTIVTLGIGYIIWGLIVWANGQTPALQVLGMRCWRPETNSQASWGYMALREVIGRLAEGILSIITLGISFFLMLTRPDRRCLHDLIAGTVVLHDPNKVLDQPKA